MDLVLNYIALLSDKYLMESLLSGYNVCKTMIIAESITKPTMDLRKLYKKINEDRQDTPKFNEAWKSLGTNIGTEAILDFMTDYGILPQIVIQWYNTGMHDEITRRYHNLHSDYEMNNDIVDIVEADPEYVANFIVNSSEFKQYDPKIMSYKKTRVNEWLVHNTSKKNAWSIWETGFKIGNPINRLAWSAPNYVDNNDPYMFAFPIDCVTDPDVEYTMPYGNVSIVFMGTGNEFYHTEDKEPQVVVNKNQPKGCFIIQDTMYHKFGHLENFWCIFGKDQYKPLFHSPKYKECLEWIKKYGVDYMSSMKHWNR